MEYVTLKRIEESVTSVTKFYFYVLKNRMVTISLLNTLKVRKLTRYGLQYHLNACMQLLLLNGCPCCIIPKMKALLILEPSKHRKLHFKALTFCRGGIFFERKGSDFCGQERSHWLPWFKNVSPKLTLPCDLPGILFRSLHKIFWCLPWKLWRN